MHWTGTDPGQALTTTRTTRMIARLPRDGTTTRDRSGSGRSVRFPEHRITRLTLAGYFLRAYLIFDKKVGAGKLVRAAVSRGMLTSCRTRSERTTTSTRR